MTVMWLETRALIEYEDGTREPLYVGMTTKREGMALLRRSWKESKFQPGDHVRLETQDFADIALTLFFGALHMRDAFQAKIKELGIEAVEPQQAPATASDRTE